MRALAALLALTVAAGYSASAQSRALSAVDVQAAIELGFAGKARPYLLHHRPGRPTDGPNPVVVGAVYTPFVRIALMAHAAWERGELLEPSDVPEALMKPVVQIAVRWYQPECPFSDQPQPWVFWAPLSPRTRPPEARDSTSILPFSVSPGDTLLKPYGERPPFEDIALVATFPLEVLRTDFEFIIMKDGTRDGRTGACYRVGRILPAELATWR